jgi:hypothetical protein
VSCYLRATRKLLTESSYRDYASCLDKLASHFLDLQIEDVEPPAGTERIEDAKRSATEVLGLLAAWPGPEPAFPCCQHRPEDHAAPPDQTT